VTDLPNPLTPADCDLAGYRWMPLDVERVIDSDTFGLSTGDEFKTAFRLWAKSWKQVPAASLPNDDRLLAHLAGIEVTTWRKRKAVALRGWILCSDDRLYHPVIAEKALEAMSKREEHAEREANEETRQQRLRARRKAMFEQLREHGIVPAYDTKTAELERLIASLPVTDSVTESVTGDVTGDAPPTAIDSDSTGQDKDIKTLGGSTHVGTPLARAKPAELSAAMRRSSIEAQPGDPRVIAAAEAGVSVQTIEAACAEAKAAKPGQRINAGYVLTIAERWTRDAAAPRAATTSRATAPRSFHEERADVIAQLTGRKAAHQTAPDGVIDVDSTDVPRRLGT
jgi:hypothetical protein